MRAFSVRRDAVPLGAILALASFAPVAAQVRISSLPAAATLTGSELIPAVQSGGDVVVTPNQIKTFAGGGGASPGLLPANNLSDVASAAASRTNLGLGTFATQNYAAPPVIGGVTPAAATFTSVTVTGIVGGIQQCVTLSSGGVIGGAGQNCLSAGGGTGQIQYNNGSGGLAGGNLSGDCVTSALTITCTKTNGTPFGAYATYGGTLGIVSGTPTSGHCAEWLTATTLEDSGGACGGGGGLSAAVYSFPNGSNPAAFTNTSFRMMGLASVNCTGPATGVACFSTLPVITPATTGRVLVTVVGTLSNGASAQLTGAIAYGTGTAPVNQAAATGTIVGSASGLAFKAAAPGLATFTGIVTGLTVGTAYWFDLQAFEASGTTTPASFAVTLVEF